MYVKYFLLQNALICRMFTHRVNKKEDLLSRDYCRGYQVAMYVTRTMYKTNEGATSEDIVSVLPTLSSLSMQESFSSGKDVDKVSHFEQFSQCKVI